MALGLVLDEPQNSDAMIYEKGLYFLINRSLLKKLDPISLDYIESEAGAAFKLSSRLGISSYVGENLRR